MPPILCCTDDDVIARFGGQEKINEALDPDRTGVVDTATLLKARQDASGDTEAAVGERYNVWGSTSFPQKIVRLASQLAVYYVWFYATGGRAIPDGVRTMKEDTLRELERIEEGKGSPGSPRPTSRLFPRSIDNSDCGRRATYAVMRRGGMLGSR